MSEKMFIKNFEVVVTDRCWTLCYYKVPRGQRYSNSDVKSILLGFIWHLKMIFFVVVVSLTICNINCDGTITKVPQGTFPIVSYSN